MLLCHTCTYRFWVKSEQANRGNNRPIRWREEPGKHNYSYQDGRTHETQSGTDGLVDLLKKDLTDMLLR